MSVGQVGSNVWSKLHLLYNNNNKEVVVAFKEPMIMTMCGTMVPNVWSNFHLPQQRQQRSGCSPLRIMTMFGTTGILMWSKLFLLYNIENKEVVVALMDTQEG